MLYSSHNLQSSEICPWHLKVIDMQHYMIHTTACERMLLQGLAIVRQQP